MNRNLVSAFVVLSIASGGAWAQAANPLLPGNTTTPSASNPPARPSAGAPRQSPGATAPSSGTSSLPRKVTPAKPTPAPRPNPTPNPTPAPSTGSSGSQSTTPGSGFYNPYGNYGYNYYGNGYYSRYGYPNGTTPYGLGYSYDGTPYLYPVTPGYGNGYGYGGYNQYGYNQYGYNPYSYIPRSPNYQPFVFGDASRLFGLSPLQQMLGVDPWGNPNNNNGAAGNGVGGIANGANANGNNRQANGQGNRAGGDDLAGDDADTKKAGRANGQANALVWKFIAYGDASFQKKKYNAALGSYRTAGRQSAVVADAWFRQGFAQAALGKYDLAAKAFRHGLDINPNWASSDFHLAEIYGNDDTEKNARLQIMTAAAQRETTNGDLALVLGIHLYFDEQSDKAIPFLRRASQISGNDGEVKGFLANR